FGQQLVIEAGIQQRLQQLKAGGRIVRKEGAHAAAGIAKLVGFSGLAISGEEEIPGPLVVLVLGDDILQPGYCQTGTTTGEQGIQQLQGKIGSVREEGGNPL